MSSNKGATADTAYTGSLPTEQKKVLFHTAHAAIEHNLVHHTPMEVIAENYPEALQKPGASFVTLHINNILRGCIGMLEACRPLIVDVAENAYAAAFKDPRFPPLHRAEFSALDIHISILNPAEEMRFSTQQDLLAQLRRGIDGLILEEGGRRYRSTFLPSVWESLPEPTDFLAHLLQKAGLPPHYWSDTLRIFRYTSDAISEEILR